MDTSQGDKLRCVTSTFQRARPGERMLPVEEAQQAVLAEVRLLGEEQVRFTDALGRVLREDVRSTHDVPYADNTAMDGYAVRSADVQGASKEAPVRLRVVEDLPAGRVAVQKVASGTATRIMTGALMPAGADAVVPVELTDAGGEAVLIFQPVTSGANLRRRAEDMKAGEIVLQAGTAVGPAELGVLASVQKTTVRVGVRPTVAILSTGDEVIDVEQTFEPGKVVNSNSYSLAALAQEAGAIPRMVGIARDTREATMRAIESALESDFVVSTGGVSVGAYDFVKDALDALGADTKFWQVAMKPGKPIVLSRVRDRLYFGLPGNPVSCMVSFILFVAPSLRKAMGQTKNLFPPIVTIQAGDVLKSRGDRRNYLRVRVESRDGQLVGFPMHSQGSGVSTSMVGANGLAILETGVTRIESGQPVSCVLFSIPRA